VDNWKIENLTENAYLNTKDRFLNYLLASLISVPFYLVGIGLSAICLLIYGKFNFPILSIIVIPIIISPIFIYLSAWTELLKTKVLINPEKRSSFTEFRELRPLIGGFVILQIKSLFFHLWLAPIYLLSLFIAPLLWVFWSMFTSFVYLEKRKKGLENIWYSRALVMKNSTTILLRSLTIGFIFFAFNILVPSGKNWLITLIKFVINFAAYPFFILFTYQMYKNLDEPQEVKPPYNWLIAGGISWLVVLSGALIFILSLLFR